MYERSMSQIIKDTEVLINNSTGSTDIATPFVHSLFECLRSREVKIQIDNPEVVLQAIQDPNMKKIIRYRQKTEGDREV